MTKWNKIFINDKALINFGVYVFSWMSFLVFGHKNLFNDFLIFLCNPKRAADWSSLTLQTTKISFLECSVSPNKIWTIWANKTHQFWNNLVNAAKKKKKKTSECNVSKVKLKKNQSTINLSWDFFENIRQKRSF